MPAFQFLYIFISSKMTFTMSFTETQAKINKKKKLWGEALTSHQHFIKMPTAAILGNTHNTS